MDNVQIDYVLNQLLEEQKNNTAAVERIMTLLKQLLEKTSIIENEFLPGDTPTIAERIRLIQISLGNNQKQKEQVKNEPLPTPDPPLSSWITIKYSYHLIAIILTGLFFIISLVFIIKYYIQSGELSRYEKDFTECRANDLKYSFIKKNQNKSIQKMLRQTDSLFKVSPQLLIDSVKKDTERTKK